jgi:hypothetical protein
VVAGFAAAALHGSKWVDHGQVVDLIHDNRRCPPGTRTHRDRSEDDEIQLVAGIPVTSPVRTALDLGCWYPIMTAVAAIDALARATEIKAIDVELLSRRYAGRRGIARARAVTERVLATRRFDRGGPAPTANTNPRAGRIRKHGRLSRHGLGRHQGRGRV